MSERILFMNLKQKLKNIDCGTFSTYRGELMGLAIISIMIFHFTSDITRDTASALRYSLCSWYNSLISSIGVEVFLFLSGMGLYFSLRNKPDIHAFYRKRLVRILSPYMLYAPIAWIIIDCVISHLSLAWVVYDVTMLSFWFQGRKTIWFITLILILYMVFPLIYNLVESRRPTLNTLITFAVIAFILECYHRANPASYDMTSIALTRIPIFIAGAYFGRKVYEKARLTPPMVILALAGLALKAVKLYFNHIGLRNLPASLATLSQYMSYYSRYLAAWYSLGLILAATVILALLPMKRLKKLLRAAGKLSLELYIVHITIRRMLVLSPYPVQSLKWYCGVILLTIPVSLLLHHVSDRIQQKLLSRSDPGSGCGVCGR